MTFGSRGKSHPVMLGRSGVVYWNPTSLLLRGREGQSSPGDVSPSLLASWALGAWPTREIYDVTVVTNDDKAQVTPRVTAALGNHCYYPIARTHTVFFRIRHYPTTTANWQPIAGQTNTPVKPFPRWLVEKWASNQPVAMAFMDSSATVSEGWIGNWLLDMTKNEPIRDVQTWEVRAVQYDWVKYRGINWSTGE